MIVAFWRRPCIEASTSRPATSVTCVRMTVAETPSPAPWHTMQTTKTTLCTTGPRDSAGPPRALPEPLSHCAAMPRVSTKDTPSRNVPPSSSLWSLSTRCLMSCPVSGAKSALHTGRAQSSAAAAADVCPAKSRKKRGYNIHTPRYDRKSMKKAASAYASRASPSARMGSTGCTACRSMRSSRAPSTGKASRHATVGASAPCAPARFTPNSSARVASASVSAPA
mmetsp:Transcript_9029/g.36902  ORF Transcript_9029/g.36902 Transcript_9029/m.36902 type:complete len:224 (+) Transcript_9029:463-1134(+)